jgi:hypothetical protein
MADEDAFTDQDRSHGMDKKRHLDEIWKRRWLVRRQGLKKEKEAGLRRIPLQPAA